MSKCVNIIIRTFNEAKWLPICLEHVYSQDYEDFVVTVVDSGSSDLTLEIASNYNANICKIDNFLPGEAINIGVKNAPNADYFVCLSAHCVPISTTWLKQLVEAIDCDENLAAVTGRQVAMNFTSSDDIRDMFMMFPEQGYVSKRAFLHNANSIIRKTSWNEVCFDPTLNHIEDLIWAKAMVDRGWSLGYCAEASVTHYHGPNQHELYTSFRAQKLTDILIDNKLVNVLHLSDLVKKSGPFLKKIFWGSSNDYKSMQGINPEDVLCLYDLQFYNSNHSIEHILNELQRYIREVSPSTSYVQLFDVNAKSENIKMIEDYFWLEFKENIIAVHGDSGNYWMHENGNFTQIQYSLDYAINKDTVYRSKIFQGSIFSINDLFVDGGTPKKIQPFIIRN